jgi:hypothetical protein
MNRTVEVTEGVCFKNENTMISTLFNILSDLTYRLAMCKIIIISHIIRYVSLADSTSSKFGHASVRADGRRESRDLRYLAFVAYSSSLGAICSLISPSSGQKWHCRMKLGLAG